MSRINGSNAEKKVVKVTKQVTNLTTGELRFQVAQAHEQALKAAARQKGRPIGEPRVYVIVEQDILL